MPKPNDLTKRIKCKERTNNGRRCKADAVPGLDICIGHKRKRDIREKKGLRTDPQKAAGGMDSILHQEEKDSYLELVALLEKLVKPEGVGDSLMIERLAIASIQARRFDGIMKDYVDEKTTARNLFYADTRIMNWLKALGVDRRFRVQLKAGKAGNLEDILRKWKHVLGNAPGTGNGGKAVLELERDDNGSETSDDTGPPEERAGGIREGSLRDDPAREAGEVSEGSGAVQKRTMGKEGGEEHS